MRVSRRKFVKFLGCAPAVIGCQNRADSEVAVLAGKKLVERTPSGQYVKDGSGKWRKRK